MILFWKISIKINKLKLLDNIMKKIFLIIMFIFISSNTYSFGIILTMPKTKGTTLFSSYMFFGVLAYLNPILGGAGIAGTLYFHLRTPCEKYEIKFGDHTRAENHIKILFSHGKMGKDLLDDAVLILNNTKICMTRTQFIIMFESLKGLKKVHTIKEIDLFFDFIIGNKIPKKGEVDERDLWN